MLQVSLLSSLFFSSLLCFNSYNLKLIYCICLHETMLPMAVHSEGTCNYDKITASITLKVNQICKRKNNKRGYCHLTVLHVLSYSLRHCVSLSLFLFLSLFCLFNLFLQKMILSLTIAAFFDSIAYVMVSHLFSTHTHTHTNTHTHMQACMMCFLFFLPQSESHPEGSLCNFQAWWLTYFGKTPVTFIITHTLKPKYFWKNRMTPDELQIRFTNIICLTHHIQGLLLQETKLHFLWKEHVPHS